MRLVLSELSGYDPDRFAGLISALLLLNYFSWLVVPATPLALVCLVAVGLAVATHVTGEIGRRRWLMPLAVVGGLLLLFFEPPTDWDARSIWFFQAKRMYFDGSIDARLDDYPGWSHTAYPSLVSALSASVVRLFGIWNEFLPKIALVLTLVPPFVVLLKRCDTTVARLLMLGSILCLTRTQLLIGSMDAHLAVYAVSAIVLLREAFALPDRNAGAGPLVPALLLISCMANIKNEGTAMAVLLLAPLAFWLIVRRRPATVAQLAGIGTLAALPAVIWKFKLTSAKILALFIGDPWERAILRLDDGSWVTILGSLLDATIEPLAVWVVLSQFMPRKLERFPLYFVIGYLGVLFLVYLATPYDLAWHMFMSVGRVTQVVKLLVAVLLVLELQQFVGRMGNSKARTA